MLTVIVRRFLLAIPTMIALTALLFFSLTALLGSPAALMLGQDASPEAIGSLNARYGFDRPLYVQYFDWITSAARGDFAEAARRVDASTTPALLDADKRLYAKTLLLGAGASRKTGDGVHATELAARLHELAATTDDEAIQIDAAIADAEQALADNRRDAALQGLAAALQHAETLNVPDDLVAAGAPYVDALIAASHLDEARAVAGRLAPFADRDLRAAWAQVKLYRALDRPDAERNALGIATRLAGDGVLPDTADSPPTTASAAR